MKAVAQRRTARNGLAAALVVLAGALTTHAVSAGEPALQTVDGKSGTLAALKGKAVLVNFWATWCAPCREEIPELNKLHAELGKRGLSIVGIAADESSEVRAFVQKVPIRYALLLGDPDAVFNYSAELGNRALGLPFTALIDARGTVRWHKTGNALTAAEVRQVALPLLNEKEK